MGRDFAAVPPTSSIRRNRGRTWSNCGLRPKPGDSSLQQRLPVYPEFISSLIVKHGLFSERLRTVAADDGLRPEGGMICVLSGGTGGAKFVDGLRQVMPAEEITLVVNTGDDLLWWGLYVSPDIDSITYVLSGMLSRERGWGVKGDTFLLLAGHGSIRRAHLVPHRRPRSGRCICCARACWPKAKRFLKRPLSSRRNWASRRASLPMSNSRVETRVDTPVGELSFEEYFVQRWYQDPVNSVRFAGASDAEPAPGVVDAITSADAVIIAPVILSPVLARFWLSPESTMRCCKPAGKSRPSAHRGQCSGCRSGRNFDAGTGPAVLNRRRGSCLRGFSRPPHL